jgi:acetyltransferase-like isoleucine patch superfamily enzyme
MRHDQHPRSTRAFLNKRWPNANFPVGDHTYGCPEIQEPNPKKLSIGKYCSIADQVTIILSNHRTDLTTTYPFFALQSIWPEAKVVGPDRVQSGFTEIGSDIWIGFGATILPHVKIGHGAIIGARSVVTRDVPPYAVVAGSPARVIRMRYKKRVIDRLLAVAWWDWSDDDVAAAIPTLMQPDIEKFLRYAETKLGRTRQANWITRLVRGNRQQRPEAITTRQPPASSLLFEPK